MFWLRNIDAVIDELEDAVHPQPVRPRKLVVPNFIGLTIADARLAAMRIGMKVKTRRVKHNPPPVMGTVVAQEPAAGKTIRRRTAVILVVDHVEERSAPAG